MGRILAIDLGKKRSGIAVTDPLQMIANPLDTVGTHSLLDYLRSYFDSEEVDEIVLGYPTDLLNRDNDMTQTVRTFKGTLEKKFPHKKVNLHDEKFTSKMALDAMLAGGTKQKDRRKKENIDRVSATIILQSYLESK